MIQHGCHVKREIDVVEEDMQSHLPEYNSTRNPGVYCRACRDPNSASTRPRTAFRLRVIVGIDDYVR